MNYLKQWWLHHICGKDKEYAPFVADTRPLPRPWRWAITASRRTFLILSRVPRPAFGWCPACSAVFPRVAIRHCCTSRAPTEGWSWHTLLLRTVVVRNAG